MSARKLVLGGAPITLGKRIGKGGEGEVFEIDGQPGFAAKLYNAGLASQREAKIKAMIGARLADAADTIAFPHQAIRDERGAFVGFAMKKVVGHREIHQLQTPSDRIKFFPKARYDFLVRVALNVARVFAQVHATGCVVGDINQRSILVAEQATVAFIDADSFQITNGRDHFLCVVGVPEYTPPELQGRSLSNVVRTLDHDAFGLAVCIFQILCMDRHPFAGRYTGAGDMPLEKAIAEYRFAYARQSNQMLPPPGTVGLEDMPPRLADYFERAFSKEGVGTRPTARMWVEALQELETALRPCSINKLHRYAGNAKECPWCRMEREYGRPLFVSVDPTDIPVVPSGTLGPNGLMIDVGAMRAALNAIQIPSQIALPLPTPKQQKPDQLGLDAAAKVKSGPYVRGVGGAIIAGGLISALAGVPGLIAAAIAAFGGWLLFRRSPHFHDLRTKYEESVRALEARGAELQKRIPIEPLVRKKAEALDALEEIERLADTYSKIKTEFERHRNRTQLEDFLSQRPIRGAKIEKLKSGDVHQLSAYGFSTALDAKKRDVRLAHGIGPVKAAAIARWVSRTEAQFQFRATYSPEEMAEVQRAQAETINRQKGALDRLNQLLAEVRREAQTFSSRTSGADPELNKLAADVAQAEANMLLVGLTPGRRPNLPPLPTPSVQSLRRGAPSSPAVPTFNPGGLGRQSAPPRPAAPPWGAPPPAPPTIPSRSNATCPQCGGRMVQRTARRGARAGKPFWGCSRYPSCRGTRPYP